jgi:hypothetical protein
MHMMLKKMQMDIHLLDGSVVQHHKVEHQVAVEHRLLQHLHQQELLIGIQVVAPPIISRLLEQVA